MKRTTRSGRLAAAALAAGLLLSGCAQVSEAQPGAAAVVGDASLSADDLQQLVDRSLADPAAQQQLGPDVAGFQRSLLTRFVRRALLEQIAAAQDVRVTAGDVRARVEEFTEQAGGEQQLLEQAAAGGVSRQDLDLVVRDLLLEERVGDVLTEDLEVPRAQLEQAYQAGIALYDRVETRHILVEDEALARDLLAQVQADPGRFAALAAEFSTDTSNADRGGDLGLAGRGQFVEPFEDAVFAAEPGDYLVVQTDFGWHVVNVVDRQTTTLREATPELRRQVLSQQRSEAVAEALRAQVEQQGVTVNPRFGSFDAEVLEVVAPDSAVSSPAPDPEQVVVPQQPGLDAPVDPAPAPDSAG